MSPELWLYAMGAAHYMQVDVLVPAAHRAALIKVPWPKVPAAMGSDGDGVEALPGKETSTGVRSHPSASSPSDHPCLGLIS